MMSKTFHGKVDETIDALIILEACRQGVMPRITRRLLAAERGEIQPPPIAPGELSSSDSSSYASSTRLPSRVPATASSTTAASVEPSSLSSATVCSSISSSSSSSLTTSSAATSSPATASPSSSTNTNPSLIIPGSVFVFDEEESKICRWTDGKIWSPSRISGNFLVYRELYRKLPHQKCYTTAEKAQMKDGSGLRDRALKEKVEEENLVVMGCMKGTFVLKKGGLVKKTICVKGINLVPPEELKRRLEGPSPALGMSRKGGRVGGGGHGGGANGRNLLPGFSTRGTQHLVCYEMPGEMDNLHGPREYLELRDLPISKTFVMIQSYRVPLQILPLDFGQQPLDPADEYIHSSRIVESRPTKQSSPPSSFNTASERPVNKLLRTRSGRQRKRIEEVESSESEGEPDYLVNSIGGGSSGGAYYDPSMTIASRPLLPPLPAMSSTLLPSTVVPVYHGYSTRGQGRYIREQVRQQQQQQQQQQQLQSWTPSPNKESATVKGKKRKRPLPRSLAMEADHTSAVKVEKPSPSMEHSYLAGRTAESDLFFQQNGIGAEDEEMGGDQHGPASGISISTLATGGTPTQMQEFLQSMNSNPLNDFEIKVHGHKTVEGEWRLVTSSMSTTTGSVTNDPFAHPRSTNDCSGGYGQSVSANPYQDGPHWHQDPGYSRPRQQQQSPWDHGAYYQMDARKTYPGFYQAQQHPLPYYEPQPQFQTPDDLQYQTPQQQTLSNNSAPYYDTAQASRTALTPMRDFQGSYGYRSGEYGQPLPVRSTTHSAATSDVSQNEEGLEMEHSDEAGYALVHQSTPHPEQGDSPWSSGSAYSRSSSLSTSLTLSPVVYSQASVDHDSGLTAELESGYQPSTDAAIVNERHEVDDIHSSTVSRISYGDESPTNQIAVEKQEGDTTTTASSNYQGHTASVSFTHTARSLTMHLAASQTPSQVSAATTMLTPDPSHRDDSSASAASSTHMAISGHQDHHQLSSPSQEKPQPQDHSFRRSVHPFRRNSQQPYVPVMRFSSGTILGTSPVDSRQGSPTTPLEEIMDSAISGSETQVSSTFPEDEVEELSSREQEEIVTGEDGGEDGPFMTQMQASPSPETPAHTPSEDPLVGEATTSATMAVSPLQKSYYSTTAGPSGAATTGSPPLPRQSDTGTYSSQPGPYSPQPRHQHMYPPSFLFHDLVDRDEFDRLLEYHSHQVEMLEEHDQGEERTTMEGHEHDGGEQFRETGEYDDREVSEQTFQQITQPPIHALTEGQSQSSGRPQMMSPGTLSALHHYSNEDFSQREGIGGASAGSVGTAAPSLGTVMVSSSGSLGQDEYLLHRAGPLITKMHLRRYGHRTGAGTEVGIETSLGVVGLGSSGGYRYMPGSGGSSSNEGLRSSGPGSGTGASRSEDLLWAVSRHDDTTSSEIACQLFSGLGALRGGGAGGENRVNASGMGVGIGTSIGSHRGGSVIRLVGYSDQGSGGGDEGEVVRGRTRSVQTLQLSDPVDRYSFEESTSRSSSPLGAQKEYVEQGDEEGEAGHDPQHHQQLMFQRDGGCVVNRMNDTIIEREDVEVEEEEEEEEVDELKVPGLYSGQSSDRTSSPVQELYYDDDRDDDEEIGQEYFAQDQAQQGGVVGVTATADQVDEQGCEEEVI